MGHDVCPAVRGSARTAEAAHADPTPHFRHPFAFAPPLCHYNQGDMKRITVVFNGFHNVVVQSKFHNLKPLWRRCRKAYGLPWADQVLMVEALAMLALVRLVVVVCPFRFIASRLGKQQDETENTAAVVSDQIRRVGWGIRLASRYTWWRSMCLEQAIVGKFMLHRRGVPSTLYLGVSNANVDIEAHAWLRCGDTVLTGATGRDEYTVISCFGHIE